jgi:hypothetical protein
MKKVVFGVIENSYVNMQHTPKPDKQNKVIGLVTNENEKLCKKN